MEWLIMNAYGAYSFSENIGFWLDGSYIIADECYDTLVEIMEKLQSEDPVARHFRRQLALMEIVKKDFLPLLTNLDPEENSDIFSLLMIVMADLTLPQEYLDRAQGKPATAENRPAMKIQEIAKLKADTQEIFFDGLVVKKIFSVVEMFLEQEELLSEQQCAAIQYIFLLIQNLLYVPSGRSDSDSLPLSYNQCLLLRTFLKENLGRIILKTFKNPQWYIFCDGVVQLLAYLYSGKMDFDSPMDQREGEINMDQGDSSADPSKPFQEQHSGGMDHSGHIEQQDHFVAPQLDGVTTHCSKCPKGKDLSRRDNLRVSMIPEMVAIIRTMEDSLCLSECNHGNVNKQKTNRHLSLSHQNLLQEIRYHLRQIETDFLKTVFNKIVLAFVNRNLRKGADRGNYFYIWTICYFITLARQLGINFQYIRGAFLREVITLLTFEGYKLWLQSSDPKYNTTTSFPPIQKQLHLVVSLFRELFRTLETHSSSENISKEDRRTISVIRAECSTITDLPMLFLLLVRNYKPDTVHCTFLSDIVETNHLILSNIDQLIQEGRYSCNIIDHIQPFASFSIMKNYGLLLQHLENNDPEVNTMALTLLHHVAGDCGKAQLLLQPSIISSFVKLIESDYPVSQDVNDLIEYIFSLFISTVQMVPEKMASILFHEEEESAADFTEEEGDLAISLYLEGDDEDVITTIANKMAQHGVRKTPDQVVKFLQSSGYFSFEEELGEDELSLKSHSSLDSNLDTTIIRNCVDKLKDLGHEKGVKWLQTSLLQVWNAKLVLAGAKPSNQTIACQPLAYFSLAQDAHVPVSVYSDQQEEWCDMPLFRSLMEALEISKERKDLYVISKTSTLESLMSKARLLGDVTNDQLLFSMEEAQEFLATKMPKMTNVPEAEPEQSSSSGLNTDSLRILWPAMVQMINKGEAKRSEVSHNASSST